ncbi:hypothetical protein [Bacillus niameyensis]|uniref:hypothetical protein n=1 Tax=Bacillus niameyensis TaxID=1522308 RepID=UPI000780D03B|nr:hypothetical protein [Bacillus niameyensis]
MIMMIKGKVKFPITLDVGSWIFDDRRIDLDIYFSNDNNGEETEVEQPHVSKHWDRTVKEGAILPNSQPKRQSERMKMKIGTFGIKLEPFLKNAEPNEDAKTLVFETNSGEISVPLHDGYNIIAQYSLKGKRLEDGPVHILYPDGSNLEEPIKNVKAFRVD